MWRFRRRVPAPPWYEEALSRAHADVLELLKRIGALEQGVSLMAEGVASAKSIERRTGALEVGLKQLGGLVTEDVARLTAALEVVRGYATGGRGGRPRNEEREADRQALDLGRRLIPMLSTPEGRSQLILELQTPGNGAANPVGDQRWSPRPAQESPV